VGSGLITNNPNDTAQARKTILSPFKSSQGLPEIGTVHSEDYMDDGTPIRLAVTIDRRNGSALFNFNGTGPQVFGNTNAPPAVTTSAVIYSLRCLVSHDIPLNGGCLKPVTIQVC
jgi:5-oxoprolinase (ATP-hydrolysing)